MPTPERLQWFPMRVTYHRELKIKERLDQLNIENFLPMKYDWRNKKKVFVPAIHNIIFVHSTQEIITDLKMRKREFAPMRYMMIPSLQNVKKTIMTVPDIQMDNFMRVASHQDDSVMFLDCKDYIGKIGKRVRITDGQFKDVEGVIKRIKKNKYVVVQIEGVAAVAITYVPACYLTELT